MSTDNPSPNPNSVAPLSNPDPTSTDQGTVVAPPQIPSIESYLQGLQQSLLSWERDLDTKFKELTKQANKTADEYSRSLYASLIEGKNLDLNLLARANPGGSLIPRQLNTLPKVPVPAGTGIPLDAYLSNLHHNK